MKIGILTFQDSINFGAQLQCLAMQEVLKEMGHQPEVIQFSKNNKTTVPFYRGINIKKNGIYKSFIILILRFLYAKKMRNSFLKFKTKHLQLSPICNTNNIAEIANQYDAIITGSDQVWGWAGHDHATYFIGWTPEYKGIRISYSPDCAKNVVEEKNKKRLTELINRYDALSVRNEETYKFVNTLTKKEPPIVVDPTFLFGFEKYITKKLVPYDNYIVIYVLGNPIEGGHQKMVEKILEKMEKNTAVIAIVLTESKPFLFPWATKVYYSADPIEWLNLLYYSSYIYTDSFHGLVFALKFKKRFIAFYNEPERAERFIDMAKRYNISRWIVQDMKDAIKKESFFYQPNFDEIETFIEQQKELSIDFLNNVIKKEN